MRVAVTGLDGFTGRYLRDALAARGHEALALDADVTDAAALVAQVEALAPDAAIHLAARAFVQSDDLDGFYRVNQVGTFNLLDALARVRPGMRVVLASSAQVYGGSAAGVVAEDRAGDPANHYALSKWAMELGARFWRDRLRITLVRPFNYSGIGQEARYLLPKIVAHFRDGADEIELGNVDVRRDFGDVRSVVEAYAGLIDLPVAAGPYNIATGRAHSMREIVLLAEQITGRAMPIRFNPAFARADDVALLVGDNRLLREALPGWAPRAVEDTLRWMLSA